MEYTYKSWTSVFKAQISTQSMNEVWLKHRDKTRVQMPAKIFPHLKLKCYLFMDPTLGFDTKQKTSFFNQIWCFLQ